jgi:DNA polymerase-3 subunit epsilon/CBS domain-containing protein
MLVGALQPALFDVSLESVTTFLGVTITDRHTAHGDCLAAARSWQKLIPILQEKYIRTLGEATALANQRQDLIMRQTESGWLDVPEGLVTSEASPTQRIDSYVFKHHLNDVMTRPAPIVSPGTTLRNAAKNMVDKKLACIGVGTPDSAPQGVITQRDIMRLTAEGELDMDTVPVERVMSSPVETIHQDDMLYRALARMDRLNVSHLCVVDDHGLPVGVVSQRNLLQYRARGSNMLYDAMESAKDVHELAMAYGHVVGVSAQLVKENLNGVEIAQVISTEIQSLVKRATQLAMDRMEQEGHGSSPADWCVLVLGSGGRGESLLSADQDNALIHNGSDNDDTWFEQFGTYLAEILDTAGLPFCNGGVMISSRQWRGNVEDWNKRVSNWIQRARPEDLLNVDIFFDLIPVAGNTKLAQRLHENAVALASKTHAFINLMAQSARSVAPKFGMLGRFVLTDGRIDLKRNGLLPLVSFARTVALRIGSAERATAKRVLSAVAAGRLSEGDAERLIELQKQLLMLILKQQISDREEGIPVGSNVDVKRLNKREQYRLRHELHHLDTMVSQIHTFTTAK